MPKYLRGMAEMTCFDCGSTAEDGDLSASKFGGDPVCPHCESIRILQARTHGIAAVVLDASALLLLHQSRLPVSL